MPAPDATRDKVLAAVTGTVSALVAGLLAAVVGTLVHGHVLYAGEIPLPWGALVALGFAGAVMVLAGLFAEKLWATALAGVVAYGVVALSSTDTRNHMIVDWSNHAVLPGPAWAGAVWTYGLVAATLVALVIAARALPRRAR
ncbi:hypothetical protein NCCP1664_02840 [Zafaria cholistanensis]|uniref:Uncharacterized protein n=1 Tax=Zafaria cholistanensis TaxID=1682741 RepID=A0A5A7NP21_9MICC|nr:hypothetical protein [Zafaria cholistanensis]GER21787.1 hypothetical protein NCCP1664_02840 [Zafaria cholistanensis]